MIEGQGISRTAGLRIFGRHHVIAHNWLMGLKAGALSVGAGDEIHVAAGNISLENNNMQNCFQALRLGASYDDPPQEPIVFINNVVSNEDDLKMIEQNPPECDYDFSQGNYRLGGLSSAWTNVGLQCDGFRLRGQRTPAEYQESGWSFMGKKQMNT